MDTCILGKTGHEKWMRELADHGRLRMSRLSTFRKVENAAIGDPHEGMHAYFSGKAEGVAVEAVLEDGTVIPIPNEDFQKLSIDGPDRDLGVYCMTMFETPGDGTISLNKYVWPFLYDPRNHDFGDVLVLFRDSPEFIRRLEAAAQKAGFELLSAKVDYHPPEYGGQLTPWDKVEVRAYAHQQEWRFVTTEPIPNEHLYLELGPLRDIAKVVTFAELKAQMAGKGSP